MLTLNQIQTEVSFDLKHRSEAAGLLSSIQTREFLATAFLFQEIFAKTGPLSRYLQSVNMDYAKALAMIDSVIASLERMRSAPQDIIDIMERSVQDSSSIQWKTTRVSRRMCRNTEDGEVLETSEESWQRKTFFVALDTIIASMRRRFDKNRSLFETLALFAPGNFTDLVKSGKSAQDLHCNVAEFCDKFQLNSNQCLQELLSFAAVYDRFHTPSSMHLPQNGCWRHHIDWFAKWWNKWWWYYWCRSTNRSCWSGSCKLVLFGCSKPSVQSCLSSLRCISRGLQNLFNCSRNSD